MLVFIKPDNEPLLIKRRFSFRQAGEDSLCPDPPSLSCCIRDSTSIRRQWEWTTVLF